MSDEQRQLAIRNRLRRREALKLTPQQRLKRMAALQEYYFEMLKKSPEAMQRFWRRNLKKRAVRRDYSISP